MQMIVFSASAWLPWGQNQGVGLHHLRKKIFKKKTKKHLQNHAAPHLLVTLKFLIPKKQDFGTMCFCTRLLCQNMRGRVPHTIAAVQNRLLVLPENNRTFEPKNGPKHSAPHIPPYLWYSCGGFGSPDLSTILLVWGVSLVAPNAFMMRYSNTHGLFFLELTWPRW